MSKLYIRANALTVITMVHKVTLFLKRCHEYISQVLPATKVNAELVNTIVEQVKANYK